METEHVLGPAEMAFYYPGHLWYHTGWLKNLLLFFDGVALLAPRYKKHEPETLDPDLVGPLKERGLLRILEAETIVNKEATAQLAEAMTKIIVSGTLDKLAKEQTAFHELSYSRLGGYGDAELADAIFSELKRRGLAKDTKDGVSIPMHPKVRVLVLVLLAQILRAQGRKIDLELAPATDRPELVEALGELVSVPTPTSTANVVAFDLDTVGVDLARVPLDEVLAFRSEYFRQHQGYARAVRRFVQELSILSEEERLRAFEDRQAEVRDMAHELKTISRRAWRRPASFALTIAGATWTLKSGNPVGAILAAAGAIVGMKAKESASTGAYSYLFSAARLGV